MFLCFLTPQLYFCLPPVVRLGRQPANFPCISPSLTFFFPTHSSIFRPGVPLSPYQNSDILRSLIQIPLTPLIPLPCHTCQISVSTSFLPPKYLLMQPSAVFEPQFSATTAHGASPFPWIPYPYRNIYILVSIPTTPPLSFVAYQYTSPVLDSLLL